MNCYVIKRYEHFNFHYLRHPSLLILFIQQNYLTLGTLMLVIIHIKFQLNVI